MDGQNSLKAHEWARLVDNAMSRIRSSFSGTELKIFNCVCSRTQGWHFCTSALLQVSGLWQEMPCKDRSTLKQGLCWMHCRWETQQGEKVVKFYSWIPSPWYARKKHRHLCVVSHSGKLMVSRDLPLQEWLRCPKIHEIFHSLFFAGLCVASGIGCF